MYKIEKLGKILPDISPHRDFPIIFQDDLIFFNIADLVLVHNKGFVHPEKFTGRQIGENQLE